MSYDIPKGYVTIREARDRLHDHFWPGAIYSTGEPDMSAEPPPGGWDFYSEPPRDSPPHRLYA